MIDPYIAQDVLDQCREALRQGKTLEYLAGRVGCDPAHLARQLGVPAAKPIPVADEPDLWSVDRLESQL